MTDGTAGDDWLDVPAFLRQDRVTGRPKFALRSLVRHTETGGIYLIMGTPASMRLEATDEPAYCYESVHGGPLWIRCQSEMEDGRFEPMEWPARASRDCPHASPHRYCMECRVTPCPIGHGLADNANKGTK